MIGTALELWRGPAQLHKLPYIAVECFGSNRSRTSWNAEERQARMFRVWHHMVKRAGGRYRRAWHYRCCAHCGSQDELTLDHVFPRSRGGCNHIHNLQLLCFDCNQAKADRLPWEWEAMAA